MNYRRVCLYGGPGSGKTTVAADIFSRFKKMHLNVEYVNEYIKNWTYVNRHIKPFDQVYIFGKQLHKEYTVLEGGVDFIVSDCSPLLNCFYAEHIFKMPGNQHLINLALEYEKHYPSISIFVKRPSVYSRIGRFQDEKESKKIDKELYAFYLRHSKNPIYSFSCEEVDDIVNKVLEIRNKKPEKAIQLELF